MVVCFEKKTNIAHLVEECIQHADTEHPASSEREAEHEGKIGALISLYLNNSRDTKYITCHTHGLNNLAQMMYVWEIRCCIFCFLCFLHSVSYCFECTGPTSAGRLKYRDSIMNLHDDNHYESKISLILILNLITSAHSIAVFI